MPRGRAGARPSQASTAERGLPVGARGAAEDGAEAAVEVAEMDVAAVGGDGGYRARAQAQFAGGVLAAQAVDQFGGGAGVGPAHGAADMRRAAPALADQFGQAGGEPARFAEAGDRQRKPVRDGTLRLSAAQAAQQAGDQPFRVAALLSALRHAGDQHGEGAQGGVVEMHGGDAARRPRPAGRVAIAAFQFGEERTGHRGGDQHAIAADRSESVLVARAQQPQVAALQRFATACAVVLQAARFDPAPFREIMGVGLGRVAGGDAMARDPRPGQVGVAAVPAEQGGHRCIIPVQSARQRWRRTGAGAG